MTQSAAYPIATPFLPSIRPPEVYPLRPAARRRATPPPSLRDLYIHTAIFVALAWLGLWLIAVLWIGTITILAPLVAARRARPTVASRSFTQNVLEYRAT